MAKKHLIIKDADENVEYDVEEIEDIDAPEEAVESTENVEAASSAEQDVCPECGKNPCECEHAHEQPFTEDEISALKELISLVPELKKMLEAKPDQAESKEEDKEEIQEIEEVKEPENSDEPEDEDEDAPEAEESEELDEEEVDEADSVTDSVGSIELTVGDGVSNDSNDCDSAEATMAERFKRYYGGN